MIDPSQVVLLSILIPIIVAVLSHLVAKLPKNGAKLAKTSCILASYITLFFFLLILAILYGFFKTQLFVIFLSSGMVKV